MKGEKNLKETYHPISSAHPLINTHARAHFRISISFFRELNSNIKHLLKRGRTDKQLNVGMAHLPTALLALNALLFFLLEVTAAEQKIITAESGQNVTLTCRAPNNSFTILDWNRDDLSKEVFVYRGGKFLPDEQHPSFKNRVDLQDRQMKDGDVSVILKNVMAADSGTYECRVQREGDSMKLMNTINLSVVAPPGPTGGTREDGGKEDGGSVGLIVGLSVSALVAVVVF